MKAGHHWIQKAKGCQSYSYAVYQERSQEVLHDDAVTATRDPQGFDKLRHIAPDQDDVSAPPGNIGSDPTATPTPRREHR